jgi:transglutaminase-like putative cysteine protease
MPETHPRQERLFLAILTAAALYSLVSSHGSALAALLLLPCGAAVFRPLPALPGWTRVAVWQALRLLLVATAAFALLWTTSVTVADRTAFAISHVAGTVLAVLATLLLLGVRTWPPQRGVIPAALGLLVATGLRPAITPPAGPLPRAPFLVTAVWAGLALAGYLLVTRGTGARRWLASGGFLTIAAGLSAGIILLLPWAQPRVEQAIARVIQTGKSYAGLSTVSRLGDIEELALARTVVMRVFTEHPQRLRARVFDSFDGVAWRARSGEFVELKPAGIAADAEIAAWEATIPGRSYLAAAEASTGQSTVRTKILQEVFNYGILVTPVAPLRVRAPGRLEIDDTALLRPWAGSEIRVYGIQSRPGVYHDPGGDTGLEEALSLPEGLDPRLIALAGQLAAGARSERERIVRTVAYLGRQCRYSLKVGRFETDQPVAEFVFDKRRGYCEYFASAAAVLLRLQGIPTRYVTGFYVSEDSYQGGHYVVREGHAHAWIEAHLSEEGWLEVETTPPGQYSDLIKDLRGGWASDLWEAVRGFFAELWSSASIGDWRATLRWLWAGLRARWRGFGIAAAVLLLARLVPRLRRRPARAKALGSLRPEAEPQLAELMTRLDRLWSRRGVARPTHRPPLEHLQGIAASRLEPGERALASQAVDCYYRVQFAGQLVQGEELQRLTDALAQASPLLGALGPGRGRRRGRH